MKKVTALILVLLLVFSIAGTAFAAYGGIVKVNTYLNVRSRPTTSSSVVGCLPAGHTVSITNLNAGNGFYGIYGYMYEWTDGNTFYNGFYGSGYAHQDYFELYEY